MRKKFLTFLIGLFLLCIFVLFYSEISVLATELEDRIAEYKQKIEELQKQEKTLGQQISLMDSQISITTLKISQTENQIITLEKEIEVLSGKIVRLDSSLDYLSKVLLARVEETYKSGRLDSLTLLFSAKNFSDFVSRYRYLQAVQLHDRELLLSMERTRSNYDEQKLLKEKIQAELTDLKTKLVTQRKELAIQVSDKKRFLEETKGKETEFQRLLAAALSEQEAILKSMQAAVLKLADGSKIEKGKEIALIGNTGYPCCSTGSHLHFMVTTGCQKDDKGYLKDCTPVNPANYLKNTSVTYEKDVGQMSFGGDWDWPIENPEITQEYGMSSWARTGYYGGKPHNGIDMVNSSKIIRAPKEGTLYRQSTSCGRCNGGCCATVNFVALDHGGGVYSWYWHIR